MSGGLAPSKSTVYISNLPFSLTNNDLHQILNPYGRVVRVTIVKDRESRKSKGIAFALFLDRNDARQCASQLNNTKLFGRTLKASIAKDNGRAAEFIRRREYPNKSRCYECGEFGHLSYKCSKNALGERVPPLKKRKDRKKSECPVWERNLIRVPILLTVMLMKRKRARNLDWIAGAPL
ncbi:hypothetical protein T265_10175 [Opisthorchis viverrini]|uniref:Zinc finger CCHC-type and RNA-binding motif-containing protein 1 n=1 Tax=Opisthorchis viverrini TaxID=6198 RepID=A0A075A2A4_OPIVI|nr:hypothetical protein T265_10175 [Opisthorchis viverrini]KER21529.1 hypothetical protein T265_10175 [Opisthorchis viverrini]